jgi:hypothetical protein
MASWKYFLFPIRIQNIENKCSDNSCFLIVNSNKTVAFCEYNGSVAMIICVAVATLANEKQSEPLPKHQYHGLSQ